MKVTCLICAKSYGLPDAQALNLFSSEHVWHNIITESDEFGDVCDECRRLTV